MEVWPSNRAENRANVHDACRSLDDCHSSEPFVYLWSWFLRLGKALLVDVPRQATQILTETPTACGSDAIGACAAAIGTEVLQLWSSAMSQPLQAFLVPQNIERAALVFALGLTVAFVLTLIPSPQSQKATRGDARTIAALVVSFLLAFYLAIISIIAIPVFGEKVPVLGPYRANLADQLKQETPTDDIKFPMLVQMDDERHTLPDISMLGLPPQLDYIGSAWKDQIFLWDQEAQRLHQSAASFPGEAREFAQTTLSFFQVSNEGHIGEIATQRHVTVLANSFNLWIADYHALLDACAATLRDGLGRARAFYETVLPVGKSMTAQANVTPEQSNQTYQQLNQALQSFYFQRCTDLKPVAREYLTMRSGPVETLGPFGAAAAWLLRTESPELALIIGLLGFGFFGALAASFIREFAGTPRNELPAIGFILPALIRGVGAAILVFLLARAVQLFSQRETRRPTLTRSSLLASSRQSLARTYGPGRAPDNDGNSRKKRRRPNQARTCRLNLSGIEQEARTSHAGASRPSLRRG